VTDFLDSLVANRLMVTDGRHYLSLAIRGDPVLRQAVSRETGIPARPASSYLAATVEVA
jgi:hypothetical protein